MTNVTNTCYGTWCNRVAPFSTSPDDDVIGLVSGGEPEWLDRLESTGALAEMKHAYRVAIEATLPPDVSLCGDQFIGPAYADASDFTGYPVDEHGSLDFKAMVEDIDLDAIVERYDPDGGFAETED
jgi:hypothetical protein